MASSCKAYTTSRAFGIRSSSLVIASPCTERYVSIGLSGSRSTYTGNRDTTHGDRFLYSCPRIIDGNNQWSRIGGRRMLHRHFELTLDCVRNLPVIVCCLTMRRLRIITVRWDGIACRYDNATSRTLLKQPLHFRDWLSYILAFFFAQRVVTTMVRKLENIPPQPRFILMVFRYFHHVG